MDGPTFHELRAQSVFDMSKVYGTLVTNQSYTSVAEALAQKFIKSLKSDFAVGHMADKMKELPAEDATQGTPVKFLSLGVLNYLVGYPHFIHFNPRQRPPTVRGDGFDEGDF
jgi:hypothetical protein